MHVALGTVITAEADRLQRELSSAEVFDVFSRTWLSCHEPLHLMDIAETHVESIKASDDVAEQVLCRASVSWNGTTYSIGDKGNGPLDAFTVALRQTPAPVFSVTAFSEHSIGSGSDTDAIAYVEITTQDGHAYWGCGRSSNIGRAAVNAVVSAVNRVAAEASRP
jgi:2-isopropylmalate synthase